MHTRFLLPFLLVCAGAGALNKASFAQTTQLLGFSDVNYLATERDVDDGFMLGQLAGHLATGLTERVAFFSEVSATARPTGFVVEVERLLLRYDFADYFKLSGGRYHTPLGYWNTAFHHGLWLQTTTARPEMIKFGGQFLPVHFVGLQVEGTFPTTGLGLSYFAGVGNGRHSNIARGGDAGDVNEHRAWLGGLSARPSAFFGLNLGAAVYVDRITAQAGTVDEQIYAAYVAWEKEAPEIIGEVAHVVHNPVGGGAATASTGYYVQLAYRLPEALAMLKPYARLERLETASDDLVFAPLGLDYDGFVAGIRFDFSLLAALKAEYRTEQFETDERFHSFVLQVSFTFPNVLLGH